MEDNTQIEERLVKLEQISDQLHDYVKRTVKKLHDYKLKGQLATLTMLLVFLGFGWVISRSLMESFRAVEIRKAVNTIIEDHKPDMIRELQNEKEQFEKKFWPNHKERLTSKVEELQTSLSSKISATLKSIRNDLYNEEEGKPAPKIERQVDQLVSELSAHYREQIIQFFPELRDPQVQDYVMTESLERFSEDSEHIQDEILWDLHGRFRNIEQYLDHIRVETSNIAEEEMHRRMLKAASLLLINELFGGE